MKKNEIVIATGNGLDKQHITLYNFNEVGHVYVQDTSYLRVICDDKMYYYKTFETSIIKIKIYN